MFAQRRPGEENLRNLGILLMNRKLWIALGLNMNPVASDLQSTIFIQFSLLSFLLSKSAFFSPPFLAKARPFSSASPVFWRDLTLVAPGDGERCVRFELASALLPTARGSTLKIGCCRRCKTL